MTTDIAVEHVPHVVVASQSGWSIREDRRPALPTTIPGLVVALTIKDHWSITHEPTGRGIAAHRDLMRVLPALAFLEHVDWTRPHDVIQSDAAARAAVRAANDLVADQP